VVYPIIYKVSTIQGDAGFLPSTVCQWIGESENQKKRIFIRKPRFLPPILGGFPADLPANQSNDYGVYSDMIYKPMLWAKWAVSNFRMPRESYHIDT